MFFKLLSFIRIVVLITVSICWSLFYCCNQILFGAIYYASSIQLINLPYLHAHAISWLVFFFLSFFMHSFLSVVFLNKGNFLFGFIKIILFLSHYFFNGLFIIFRFYDIFLVWNFFSIRFFRNCWISELLRFLFEHLSFWMLCNELFGSLFGSI